MKQVENKCIKSKFYVEEEFFLIESEKLDEVKTVLYGFCIQQDGIFEQFDIEQGMRLNPSGQGVYVYIEREGDRISIWQDFNGSWGIYLFKQKDKFILSNSFLRLLDYVKCNYEISLNEDYAKHFVISGLCSVAYSETMINEIQVLPKNAVIEINVKSKAFILNYVDYKENTVELDSEKGIQILDNWFFRWTNVIKSIKAQTNNLQIALSGGFDSRITFMLALKSGIDLNEVRINSIKDELHTHSEDYEIASEIADYYQFKLNGGNFRTDAINYTMEDIVNISFYTKLSFHKQMYYKTKKYIHRRFMIPGSAGECIRSYWDLDIAQMKKAQMKNASSLSRGIVEDLKKSQFKIMDNAFDIIGEKYKLKDAKSTDFSLNLYRDTRCRNHFGKGFVEDYFANVFSLAPLLDPELHMLKLSDEACTDKNLLMALIYSRYCPKLLDFKFEGGREIKRTTIDYAKEINHKYPFLEQEIKIFNKKMKLKLECVENADSHEAKSIEQVNDYVTELFRGRKTRHIFTSFLDDEIYRNAQSYAERVKYHSLQHCYTIIGIAKVLNDVYFNKSMKNTGLDGFFEIFSIKENEKNDDILFKRIECYNDYLTARLDIKIIDDVSTDIEVLSVSDDYAFVKQPDWFQKNGTGFVIESYALETEIILKCLSKGDLKISFKSKDVRDAIGKKVPMWINYEAILYNDKSICDSKKVVWHDKPFVYAEKVNAGDIVRLQVKWSPHLTFEENMNSKKLDTVGNVKKVIKKYCKGLIRILNRGTEVR